ncbi:MAG: two-component sensor histidine kinase [Algicola sp.]|nr:two-component sensor histidine kinase [Algicola sp.]
MFIAIFGLGWTLDELFGQYQSPTQSDELAAYRQMGSSLAQTVDQQKTPQQFVADWPTQNRLTLNLMDLTAFPLPQSLQKDFQQGKPLELESDDKLSIHFILPTHQQVLTLSLPLSLVKQDDTSAQLAFTTVFYAGILLVVLSWLYPLLSRLKQLRTSAKAFGEGQLSQRISTKATSYIADIEAEFNRMAQRIETLISDNKLLGNAVSHDLRTPLARLRFGIEALQETQNPKTREKYQNHISRDIDEMENLVNVLLSYARLDQAMIEVDRQPIDLNSLVNDCVSCVDADDKTVRWKGTDDTALKAMVLGDGNYLTMLVNNLLGNARQYATTAISVSVTKTLSGVILTIADDGPGIAQDKRDELLKPFTRGDNIAEKQGFGMGLAIVSRIALWHKAQLVISQSNTLGGAEFTLTFNTCPGDDKTTFLNQSTP